MTVTLEDYVGHVGNKLNTLCESTCFPTQLDTDNSIRLVDVPRHLIRYEGTPGISRDIAILSPESQDAVVSLATRLRIKLPTASTVIDSKKVTSLCEQADERLAQETNARRLFSEYGTKLFPDTPSTSILYVFPRLKKELSGDPAVTGSRAFTALGRAFVRYALITEPSLDNVPPFIWDGVCDTLASIGHNPNIGFEGGVSSEPTTDDPTDMRQILQDITQNTIRNRFKYHDPSETKLGPYAPELLKNRALNDIASKTYDTFLRAKLSP